MTNELKNALIEKMNHAILILGGIKVRVDEIATIGFPVSQAIQDIGEVFNALREEAPVEEQHDEQAADN